MSDVGTDRRVTAVVVDGGLKHLDGEIDR